MMSSGANVAVLVLVLLIALGLLVLYLVLIGRAVIQMLRHDVSPVLLTFGFLALIPLPVSCRRGMLHLHIDAAQLKLIKHLVMSLLLRLPTFGAGYPTNVVVLLIRGPRSVGVHQAPFSQGCATKSGTGYRGRFSFE